MSESAGESVLLIAAATATTGGGERHVADLLRRLPARGIRVGLACPPGGDLGALATLTGAEFFEADIASGYSPSEARAVRSAIDAFRPDVVHAHGSRAALFARLADSRACERLLYTLHGIHLDKAGTRARQAALLGLERGLRSRTAAWICVCGSNLETGERLKILSRGRAHVVYNGIETPVPPATSPGAFRRELGIDADTPLALSIGRFDVPKDQRTLLDAWASARAAAPGAVLALVGSGELEGKLRVRAMALGLGDSVRFVPPRPDVASLYADADLFVLSSRWEGLPYVVLEAMAYELPVVSTAVDGIPEAVINEDTGLLVPAHDAGSRPPCARCSSIRSAGARWARRAASASSGTSRSRTWSTE